MDKRMTVMGDGKEALTKIAEMYLEVVKREGQVNILMNQKTKDYIDNLYEETGMEVCGNHVVVETMEDGIVYALPVKDQKPKNEEGEYFMILNAK
jgi:hypothetical protein